MTTEQYSPNEVLRDLNSIRVALLNVKRNAQILVQLTATLNRETVSALISNQQLIDNVARLIK